MRYLPTLLSPVHHLVGFESSHSFPNQPSQLLLQQYPGQFVGLDKKSRYNVMTAFLSTKFLLKRKKNREPYRIVLGWDINIYYCIHFSDMRAISTNTFTSMYHFRTFLMSKLPLSTKTKYLYNNLKSRIYTHLVVIATLRTQRFAVTVSFRRFPSSFYESYYMGRSYTSTSLMPQHGAFVGLKRFSEPFED